MAATVFAQAAPAPAGPQASGTQDSTSAAAKADAKAAPATSATQAQQRGSGRASNRKPMDIRLRDGGVKLPKCTNESREGMDCEK